MFGIVLSSNHAERTALIWCDDHKDLAVLRLSGNWDEHLSPPEPGDMIRFDLHEGDGVRTAANARCVAPGLHPGLPDALRTAAATPHPAKSEAASKGTVVQFPRLSRRTEEAYQYVRAGGSV